VNADPATPSLIQWQLPMRRMLYALAPLAVAAVYFFGWRALLLLLLSNAVAFLTEMAFTRRRGEPVTSAALVTGTLLALALPPATPFWMAAVGAAFAITFGKMVFGGFGRNVFNPALAGRAFLYVSFPVAVTGTWLEPVPGSLGGLAAYAADAVSKATPNVRLAAGETIPYLQLLLGRTSGSLGETCSLLIVLGGLYIVWRRAADWRLVVSSLLGVVALLLPLWLASVPGAPDPLSALLSGSVLFGVFFFITEPVSAPKTRPGKWIYGLLFGALVAVIRVFSVWPAGTMFAVLLANTFAPIIDHAVRTVQARSRSARAAKA
jgi:Na+-transporting NADH:ubiquinone oxidoreductase subunit B